MAQIGRSKKINFYLYLSIKKIIFSYAINVRCVLRVPQMRLANFVYHVHALGAAICARGHVTLYTNNVYIENINRHVRFVLFSRSQYYASTRIPVAILCCRVW